MCHLIDALQSAYQDYAFIDPNEVGGVAKPLAGATLLGEHIISRSYEDANWYLIVYKPFDRAYHKNPSWYQVKGLDYCRKNLGRTKGHVLTREIMAEKTHINAIVCTTMDMISKHESNAANKYKLHVQHLSSPADRHNALVYIQKENKQRPFLKYLDYQLSK